MKLLSRYFILAIAATALTACVPATAAFDALASAATQAGPSANAALAAADGTVLDEKAAIAVELAYQASATAILTATRAGFIQGETAKKVAAADLAAYRAVLLVRASYQTGNARSYGEAATKAVTLIKATLALLKGA